MNNMLLSNFKINEPISNVFEPADSVVPERLRSITTPNEYPILGEKLNSSTEPINFDHFEEELVEEN